MRALLRGEEGKAVDGRLQDKGDDNISGIVVLPVRV